MNLNEIATKADVLAVRQKMDRIERLLMSEEKTLPPYLNTIQAAEYLNCSKAQIYKMVRQKLLKARGVGRRKLFRRTDLDHILEEGVGAQC